MGSAALSGFLLDTHIWLWYVGRSDRLPHGLRHLVAEAPGDCWFSPVSVWELGILSQRGRVELDPDVRRWVEDSLELLPLREAPINLEVALTSNEMERTLTDPADRLIAATARVYELTLLTVDHRLKGLRGLRTRSR